MSGSRLLLELTSGDGDKVWVMADHVASIAKKPRADRTVIQLDGGGEVIVTETVDDVRRMIEGPTPEPMIAFGPPLFGP